MIVYSESSNQGTGTEGLGDTTFGCEDVPPENRTANQFNSHAREGKAKGVVVASQGTHSFRVRMKCATRGTSPYHLFKGIKMVKCKTNFSFSWNAKSVGSRSRPTAIDHSALTPVQLIEWKQSSVPWWIFYQLFGEEKIYQKTAGTAAHPYLCGSVDIFCIDDLCVNGFWWSCCPSD